MLIAITRGVSPSIAGCELTHLTRTPIDLERARSQHAAYEAALVSCGVKHCRLATEPELPDSVFVEDTAVVLDELAIMTRPGAASRRPETTSVAAELGKYRQVLHQIETPGTLDGGDVVCVGKRMFVGLSSRTNAAGAEQLRKLVEPLGISVTAIEIAGCLHLQSAATQVAPETLLINPAWVKKSVFHGLNLVEIDPTEPDAANVIYLPGASGGDAVVVQPQFPRTLERLARAGLRIVPVDMSELGKAEGALTCCSIVFRA